MQAPTEKAASQRGHKKVPKRHNPQLGRTALSLLSIARLPDTSDLLGHLASLLT